MLPPSPTPVRKRQIASSCVLAASAQPKEPAPTTTIDATSTARRPSRSPSGASSAAPSPIPRIEEDSAMPKAEEGRPHSADSVGTVSAINCMSKPSNITASAQSTITRICRRESGRPSIRSLISIRADAVCGEAWPVSMRVLLATGAGKEAGDVPGVDSSGAGVLEVKGSGALLSRGLRLGSISLSIGSRFCSSLRLIEQGGFS